MKIFLNSSKKFDAYMSDDRYICNVAAVALGAVGGAMFASGGGSSVPATDPGVSAAAAANAQVSADSLAFNKQVYEDNKPRQAAADALSTRVVNDQLAISEQNQKEAASQWDTYQKLFAPVEAQTVADATNIDSPAELERASGAAASGVQTQFDNAAGQRKRAQASMGIDPNSGRAAAADSNAQLGLAASKADASNTAVLAARDRGISLRAGVANFGRNMPNTAANAYGVAMNGGNSAVSNQNSTMAAANANASQMNQGYGVAISGNDSAGRMLNSQYDSQVKAWGAQQQADATSSAGYGQLAGAIIASSKKFKTNKKGISDAKTLAGVKSLPVEKWDYKKGISDGGTHVGAYAEDVQKKFGDHAAPGGKVIDVASMHGITLSAVKGLSKQVDKLESKVAKLSPAKRGIKKG